MACGRGDALGQDERSAGWPEWQRIEAGAPPPVWRLEQASFAFNAWATRAVVTSLTTRDEATTIRFDDGDGGILDVRRVALPTSATALALSEGDAVHVDLIRLRWPT